MTQKRIGPADTEPVGSDRRSFLKHLTVIAPLSGLWAQLRGDTESHSSHGGQSGNQMTPTSGRPPDPDRQMSRNAEESACERPPHDPRLMEGFVFFPENYHPCLPFWLTGQFWVTQMRVGRGPEICRSDLRDYLPYRIRYEDDRMAILAVPVPTEQEPPLPHEYYLPTVPFQFLASDGEFAFQTTCEEAPTPVQHGIFTQVI